MRQSELFTKTRKEAPKDEVAKNAILLIRAGYIHKEMAGVYSYLPLGFKVLNKVNRIIREEMERVGGKELFLSSLQNKEVWEKTNRWDDKKVDNWFKTKITGGNDAGLAFTHEEPLTFLMRDYIRSFRDLPVYVYQIQTKFRNEQRAKSGIIRAREFLMKDLYSFSRNEKDHAAFYEMMKTAYKRIFEKAGIGEKTYMTYASGGSFSKYSHEFQTLTSAGEDTVFLCPKCKIAVNEEIIGEQSVCPECGNSDLGKAQAVEVGNIFSLGTRFSEALDLKYIDEGNKAQFVVMGSYGIGPGRLIGTVVEVLSDEKGIVWPETISPFDVHLILLMSSDKKAKLQAESLYKKLGEKNIEVLFDDRDLRAGEKFADADLIGIPWRITVSENTAKSKKLELKSRQTGKEIFIGETELLKLFSKKT